MRVLFVEKGHSKKLLFTEKSKKNLLIQNSNLPTIYSLIIC